MGKEITYDNLAEKIFNKCEMFLLNEGEQPNTLAISPEMASFLENFTRKGEKIFTFFGMYVYVSSDIKTLDDIEVYSIVKPDKWKNII